MVGTPHLTSFFQTGHQGVGRGPDQHTDEQDEQHVLDVFAVTLRTFDAFHARP